MVLILVVYIATFNIDPYSLFPRMHSMHRLNKLWRGFVCANRTMELIETVRTSYVLLFLKDLSRNPCFTPYGLSG